MVQAVNKMTAVIARVGMEIFIRFLLIAVIVSKHPPANKQQPLSVRF